MEVYMRIKLFTGNMVTFYATAKETPTIVLLKFQMTVFLSIMKLSSADFTSVAQRCKK